MLEIKTVTNHWPAYAPVFLDSNLSSRRDARPRQSWLILFSLGIVYEANRRLFPHQSGRPLLQAIQYHENPQCGFSRADKERDSWAGLLGRRRADCLVKMRNKSLQPTRDGCSQCLGARTVPVSIASLRCAIIRLAVSSTICSSSSRRCVFGR